MIDYTIKGKLRFNDPLTFNESHILYDCVEKLEQIEQIVEAYTTDNPREPMYDTEDYMNSIREVLNG